MTTAYLEPVLMPLPHRVKPFHREDISSYIWRLADANRLNGDALCRHITGTKRIRNVPIDRLAIVAGLSAKELARAIIDPDRDAPAKQHLEAGTACRLCAARHGAAQRVTCWRPVGEVVCLHHRRWIGSSGREQPVLDRQPVILRAYQRHLRLVRRFGREDVTPNFIVAGNLCREWHDQHRHDEAFMSLLDIFHGPDWRLLPDDPTVEAARYPQAVALTRLLTSPYWNALAISASPTAQAMFAREMRLTVAPSYHWPQPRGSKDPLYEWLIGDALFGKIRRRTGTPSVDAKEPWDD